jgi:hypothetical protein
VTVFSLACKRLNFHKSIIIITIIIIVICEKYCPVPKQHAMTGCMETQGKLPLILTLDNRLIASEYHIHAPSTFTPLKDCMVPIEYQPGEFQFRYIREIFQSSLTELSGSHYISPGDCKLPIVRAPIEVHWAVGADEGGELTAHAHFGYSYSKLIILQ